MPVVYVSVEQVVQLHARTIERHGGAPGLRSQALLESAVMRPRQSVFGRDAYPTIQDKAAVYALGLVMNHPFVDGNKRVGFLAMITFLALNGFRFAADGEEIDRAVRGLAAGEMSREAFVGWVKSHSHELAGASGIAR
jgi:death-on-curing protein